MDSPPYGTAGYAQYDSTFFSGLQGGVRFWADLTNGEKYDILM
jgi:hypothetical protein